MSKLLKETGYTLAELNNSGIFPQEVFNGKFSPIMASRQYLEDIAYEVAQIIDDHERRPLSFEVFLEEYNPNFIPDCDYYTSSINVDTRSGSSQVGNLNVLEAKDVVDCKMHCAECPLSTQCLAVSMAGLQITRATRKERTIPAPPGDREYVNLVMDDFLIFGGLTPRERRIVFNHVCDILEEKDSHERRTKKH